MGISQQQALDCFASDDLIGIGMEADAVRRRLHPEGVVSYVIDRTIRLAQSDVIYAAVEEASEMGATSVSVQPEATSTLTLDWFESLFAGIRSRVPSIWLHSLSAGTILTLADHAGLSLAETLVRLRDAGLNSIPGDDAGILNDCSRSRNWLEVHRTAHKAGLKTTACMTFGRGETPEQRVAHLESIRELQAETGGFSAFIPTTVPASIQEEATAVEYLKTLAVSRMFLEEIDNVQADWTVQGLKTLQMALRFGGNDVGSVLLETSAIGIPGSATEEELRRVIRDAGFRPVQRDTLYRTMFLN
jgi:cyclic dehypoxanthinyl futalosine synthase